MKPDILASTAGVAELVDAPVSKTGEGNLMPVRFRPSAIDSFQLVLLKYPAHLYFDFLSFIICSLYLVPVAQMDSAAPS